MSALSTGLLLAGAAGAAIQSYGQYQEGQSAAQASRYNADIARQNAQIAEQSAAMTEESGALDALRQRKQVNSLIGSQRAIRGKSGIEWTGSALDTAINTATEGELDAQIMEFNTKVKASGYRSQAGRYLSEADENNVLATNYERAGAFKAGSTLLTAASKLYTPGSSAPKISTPSSSYGGGSGYYSHLTKLKNPYNGSY